MQKLLNLFFYHYLNPNNANMTTTIKSVFSPRIAAIRFSYGTSDDFVARNQYQRRY